MKFKEFLTELNYNKPKPVTGMVKKYVEKDTPGSHEEHTYTTGNGYAPTGKHIKFVRQPMKDAEGKHIIKKPFADAKFVKKTNHQGDHTRGGKAGLGEIHGAVGEWLDKMGASREHLAPALEKVRASKEYKDLMDRGFEEKSTPGDLKNGSMKFVGHYDELMGSGEETRKRVARKVLANGNIAHVDRPGRGRGNTHHPVTKDTHPHLSPVERIEHSMRQSIDRIGKIHDVQSKRHFVKSLKD